MSKGLYIHIPFCKTLCSYCDFPKIIAKEENHINYISKLLEEIDSYNNELNNISSVYFGGGTPNSISLSLLEKVFIRVKNILASSSENSIELNPELITEELCDLLLKYNINRVSIGVQTINQKEIKLLNRHHSKELVIEKIELLRKKNITNINCDFIFGIPGQNINDIYQDLKFIEELKLPHISYYSLILEAKTVLEYKIKKKEISILDDDIVADMYELIVKRLKSLGYHHYEVSNFSYNGYEAKHNMLYWNCDEYIGIGAGACGYINDKRYQNHRIINQYLNDFLDEEEIISINEKKKEYFLLGLRMLDGVSIKKYKEKFKSDPFKDFNISSLIDKGLLEIDNDYLRIPEDKIFIANLVFEEFVGD